MQQEVATKTIIVASAVVGVSLLLFLVSRKQQKDEESEGTPIRRVPGYPVVGNLFDLLPSTMIPSCERWVKKHGPILRVNAVNLQMILVADPAMCREILNRRPKIFRRVRSLDYSAEVIGLTTGLFHTFGAKWSRIRKATSPTLAKHHVVNNLLSILQESLDLVHRLESQADGNSVINVKEEMFQYTLRLICRLAFGLKNPSKEFSEYFLQGTQFSKDVLAIFNFMMDTATFPFNPYWYNKIPAFARVENAAVEGNARFDRICKQIIDEKRRELADNPNAASRFSVIDILIDKENQPTDVEGGEITDTEIVANVKSFFIAGSDTTSIVLTWAVYYLWMVENKDILDEVRAEADRFFAAYKSASLGGEEVAGLITKEIMPLTNAVIKETARLCGPGPMIFLETESTTESYTLSNGVKIPPHAEVVVLSDCVHWDETVFTNSKSFVPRRWLANDASQLASMEGSFLAFGHGPRVCPGMTLAINEAVIGLTALVHHLDFHLGCSASEIERVFTFVAQPNKMPMTVRCRPF